MATRPRLYVSRTRDADETQTCLEARWQVYLFLLFNYSTNGYFRFACMAITTIALKFHNDNRGLETNQVCIVPVSLNAYILKYFLAYIKFFFTYRQLPYHVSTQC